MLWGPPGWGFTMAWSDLISDAADTIADTFGESATYTAIAGGTTALSGVTFAEMRKGVKTMPAVQQDRDGESVQRDAMATIDVASIAAPARGDSLTVGDQTWTVSTATPVAGGTRWQLKLTRSDSSYRAREGRTLRR